MYSRSSYLTNKDKYGKRPRSQWLALVQAYRIISTYAFKLEYLFNDLFRLTIANETMFNA